MKVASIKALVEAYNLQELKTAEEALYDEKPLEINVEGEDAGEQLTHILAAIDILQNMAKGMEFKDALRAYSARVRNSIN